MGLADDATPPPDWGTLRRKLLHAAARDAVLLALLFGVPGLRRFRAWYWRLLAVGSALAMLYGILKGVVDERRRRPLDDW